MKSLIVYLFINKRLRVGVGEPWYQWTGERGKGLVMMPVEFGHPE